VANGIAARSLLSSFRLRTCTLERVATVGLELFDGCHLPAHAFDETRGLIAFAYLICREPETAFEEYASKYLCDDKIRHLDQKFPRENFESIEEWAVAVAEEVKSVLLPATPGFARLDPDRLGPATEALRTEVIKMRSFVTTIHMGEFLEHDLAQQERLDARIARLTRELVEIKTAKQVLRRTQ